MKRIYGNRDHADISVTLNSLGEIYENLVEYENAKRHYIESFEMMKWIYGDKDHRDISVTLYKLALLLRDHYNI